MRIATLLTVILLTLLTPGCFLTRNTNLAPISPDDVAQLEPGVTTAADTVRILGAPTDVVQLGRRSAYQFDFTQTKRAGLFLLVVAVANDDVRQDRVWAFFDENDVLTHIGATFEAADAKYATPWQDLHEGDGKGEE